MARKDARKTSKKASRNAAQTTSRRASNTIDESSLTKGQLRKLNALRKSVGDEIGTKAFAEWLATQSAEVKEPVDKNAERIADALKALIDEKKLMIPRGGYLVRRGRGRVIVTRAKTD